MCYMLCVDITTYSIMRHKYLFLSVMAFFLYLSRLLKPLKVIQVSRQGKQAKAAFIFCLMKQN